MPQVYLVASLSSACKTTLSSAFIATSLHSAPLPSGPTFPKVPKAQANHSEDLSRALCTPHSPRTPFHCPRMTAVDSDSNIVKK